MRLRSLDSLIKNRKVWFVIFIISFLFYLAYATIFEPKIDDAYLGEQLYWLLVNGKVSSNLMSGFRDIGIENLWTVFHKGTIYYGYLWSKLFGWSIPTLHMGSIIASFGFLGLLFIYFRDKRNRFTPNAFLIVASICLLFFYFAESAGRFRPEMLVLFFGFLSYFMLDKYLSDKRVYQLVLAAFSAGISMFCHLNALIIIAAGFILLMLNKQWLKAILFGFIASVVFFVGYFMDVFLLSDFPTFLNQFVNDPALNSSHFHWYSPFLKLLGEWKRYFHADVNTVFALPFFLILILSFKHLWKKSRNLMVYMLTMMLILSFYTYDKHPKYLVPLVPFMAILMVQGISFISQTDKHGIIRRISMFLFLLYFPIAAFLLSTKIYQVHTSNILKTNQEIGELVGTGNRIMADEMFIFNEIKNQTYIVNVQQFLFFQSFHGLENYTFDECIEEANRRDIDFFVLRYLVLDMFRERINSEDLRYSIFAKTSDYVVLKLN